MSEQELQVLESKRSGSPGDNGVARESSREAKGGFGILKPGRGYWVRVMTAVCLGTLFLSTALWAWAQLDAFEPPVRAWNMRVANLEGATPKVGDKVELAKVEDNSPVVIGSGVVESASTEGEGVASLTVKDVLITDEKDSASDTQRISIAGSGGAPVFMGTLSGPPGKDLVYQRVYVQGAAAAMILLAGLFVIYRFVGNKPGSVDFLIATDEEMRKVNWSTRKIIMDSTSVVIGATFLIALYIFVTDMVFKQVLLNQFVGR